MAHLLQIVQRARKPIRLAFAAALLAGLTASVVTGVWAWWAWSLILGLPVLLVRVGEYAAPLPEAKPARFYG